MLNTNMSKSDIEKAICDKGSFVKIDWLTRLLNQQLSLDMKKFVLLRLADVYEKTNMIKEAAKMYGNAGIVSITFKDKMKYFVKEAELLIEAGDFNKADQAMKKAMVEANSVEKEDIYFTVKEIYVKKAEQYEGESKRNSSVKIYEHILEMKLTDLERKKIKEKLLDLYEKLGKIREYSDLKRNI